MEGGGYHQRWEVFCTWDLRGFFRVGGAYNQNFTCTLYNISFVITGLRITSDVLIGKSTWDVLFQPPNFFSKYKYMISPFFVCLNVTLSISSSGLCHKLNVCLKVDAIKICFVSVVFYWWFVCDNDTLKYSRWKNK